MKFSKKTTISILLGLSTLLIIALILRLVSGSFRIPGFLSIKGYESSSIYLFVTVLLLTLIAGKTISGRVFLVSTLLLFLTFITLFQLDYYPVEVTGDGVGYFSYLHSLYFDRDLNFNNEYVRLNALKNKVARAKLVKRGKKIRIVYRRLKRTGMVPNAFSIGPAILWMPFYALTDFFYRGKKPKRSGYESIYLNIIRFSTVFYGFAGIFLLFMVLRRFFDETTGILAVFTILLASPMLYYFKNLPFYSHILSFFAVSAFLYLFYRIKDSTNPLYWGILGIVAGLAALVRWQNSIFASLPVIYLVAITIKEKFQSTELWKRMLNVVVLTISFFITFLPQMIAFKILYGSYFTVPQGGKFLTSFPRYMFHVLFSGHHGLFNWHPLLIIGLIGFLLPLKIKDPDFSSRTFFYLALLAFLLQWWMNGSITQYWAGASFGARRFISSLAFLALGTGNFIKFILSSKRTTKFYILLLNLFFIINFFMVKAFSKVIPAEEPFGFAKIIQSMFTDFFTIISPKTMIFLFLYLAVLNTGFHLIITPRFREIRTAR